MENPTLSRGAVPARPRDTARLISTFSPVLNNTHAQWTAIYNQRQLAEGEYLNLYDIGWDNPEGHVCGKGQALCYGFFTRVPGESSTARSLCAGFPPDVSRDGLYAEPRGRRGDGGGRYFSRQLSRQSSAASEPVSTSRM